MTRMRILTPHLALTYPNHCPTSCRTNSHFVHENDPWTQQFNPIPNLKSIDPLEVTFKKCMPLLESRISTIVPSTNTQTVMHHNEITKHNSMTGTFTRFSFQHARIGLFISGLVLGLVLAPILLTLGHSLS